MFLRYCFSFETRKKKSSISKAEEVKKNTGNRAPVLSQNFENKKSKPEVEEASLGSPTFPNPEANFEMSRLFDLDEEGTDLNEAFPRELIMELLKSHPAETHASILSTLLQTIAKATPL